MSVVARLLHRRLRGCRVGDDGALVGFMTDCQLQVTAGKHRESQAIGQGFQPELNSLFQVRGGVFPSREQVYPGSGLCYGNIPVPRTLNLTEPQFPCLECEDPRFFLHQVGKPVLTWPSVLEGTDFPRFLVNEVPVGEKLLPGGDATVSRLDVVGCLQLLCSQLDDVCLGVSLLHRHPALTVQWPLAWSPARSSRLPWPQAQWGRVPLELPPPGSSVSSRHRSQSAVSSGVPTRLGTVQQDTPSQLARRHHESPPSKPGDWWQLACSLLPAPPRTMASRVARRSTSSCCWDPRTPPFHVATSRTECLGGYAVVGLQS